MASPSRQGHGHVDHLVWLDIHPGQIDCYFNIRETLVAAVVASRRIWGQAFFLENLGKGAEIIE